MEDPKNSKWNSTYKVACKIGSVLAAVGGVWSFFTSKQTPFEFIYGGVPVNATPWILLCIAIGLLIPWRRIKPRDELFLVIKHIKLGPTVFICLMLIFLFMFLWGVGEAKKSSKLEGDLESALNPKTYDTNSISISGLDTQLLKILAKNFFMEFQKTNATAPKVVFILNPSSLHSRHLLRQLTDIVDADGWNYEIQKSPLAYPITEGIWIYSNDANRPNYQVNFWKSSLQKCRLEEYESTWGTGGNLNIGKQDVILVINDPDYFY